MPATLINAIEAGARPDGQTLNTAVLQAAIDRIGQAGGGRLIVPPGVFVTGSLTLRSRLTLELQPGAVLKGSGDIADYTISPARRNPDAHKDLQPYNLLLAQDLEDVTICGGGTLDGSGPAFWNPPSTCEFFTEKARRPSPMLEFCDCRNVRLLDITIANSPGWTVNLNGCAEVWVRGVAIRNDLRGPNTDGLDITDSRDVHIADCNIVAGDDAIVLKSLGGRCERIVVTNCIVQTRCSALKLGANESLGTIRQVAMSNCVVRDSSRGLSLYCMTGGLFEDITFGNIVLECHNDMPLVCPIHINASRNPAPERARGVGRIRHVRISDVLCKSDARILLTAEAGHMLEDIHLAGIHMEYPAVENRFEQAARAVGLQFSPYNPAARAARAVVAAENIQGFSLRDLTTAWPAAPGVDMQVLWARNVRDGFVDCPLARPSRSGLPALDIRDCALEVRAPRA